MACSQSPNDKTFFIGFLSEAVFYGFHSLLFLIAISEWNALARNKPIFCATVLLFMMCSVHFFVFSDHVYNHLINHGFVGMSFGTTRLIAATLCGGLANFVGDLTLIYRLSNFYQYTQGRMIVILPLILSFFGLVAFIISTASALSLLATGPHLSASVFMFFEVSGYAFPLVTNVIVTSLILRKVWRATQGSSKASIPASTRRVIATIIESGALYLVAQFTLTILRCINHPSQSIVAFITVQIYGIAPNLITTGIVLNILSGRIVPMTLTKPTHLHMTADDAYVITHVSVESLSGTSALAHSEAGLTK